MSKFNKGFCSLLCVIYFLYIMCYIYFFICFILCVDIFSKYTWVFPLKDKKAVTITNAFQKTLDDSKKRANKKRRDKVSEFYNRSIKSWL